MAGLSGGATAVSESLEQLNAGLVEPHPWRPSSVIRPRKIPFIPLFWEKRFNSKLTRLYVRRRLTSGGRQSGLLQGDEQSDLSINGGVCKAVYAYPSERYQFWRGEVPGIDLPLRVFGENFTTEGLLEEAVRIGGPR